MRPVPEREQVFLYSHISAACILLKRQLISRTAEKIPSGKEQLL